MIVYVTTIMGSGIWKALYMIYYQILILFLFLFRGGVDIIVETSKEGSPLSGLHSKPGKKTYIIEEVLSIGRMATLFQTPE